MSDVVASASPILIVDDDPIARALMRATLEVDGYEIIEAEDGEAACALYQGRRPELLIADVVMPRMDGFALCRELRSRPESAYVPILMATGLDDVPSITKAYEVGATDFIAKPINWVVLGHRVRYMLRASRAFDELRHNRDGLIAAKNEAEAASRAKTEFLANMGHELRTPLNAIIGFSTIMRDATYGPIAEKYVEYAGAIAESGQHLLAVINGILDMARAEANRLVLVEEEVEIARAVAFSLGTIEEMARRADIDCQAEIPDDLPRFLGDAAKLRQILINLLSNAVKFTPPGGSVRVSVETPADDGLVFRIADTGIGIAPEKLPVALAPFGQIESGLDRRYEGVGLGLPLAKKLVELHGGTMEIDSELDKGTSITARFPRERIGEAAD
ncbi:MAG: hybrid sensor histidine kinase/response regulator [Stellaceae bacterium]